MTRLSVPFEIPGYRIVRRIGLGGMATVYMAIQESLSRPVAVKVLARARAVSKELVTRFENEARVIARLEHPHIVSIFDVGQTSDGRIYYTMPYMPNGDLSSRSLRDDPVRVLSIIHALAAALQSAHDQGVIHRDVKPENVLFDSQDRPMLADFGIALSETQSARVTREGATVGSSGYMSPEQARGEALDARSDLYSLGVVCYELLTGELPFQGNDALAIALAHIEKPVPRLPLTRRVWQPFIDKALAKQPGRRFQSAEEMLAALDLLGRRQGAPSDYGLRAWWSIALERLVAVPRRRRALALVAVLALLLAGLLALLPQKPERAAAPAPHPAARAASAATPPPLAETSAAAPQTSPAPPAAITMRSQQLQRAGDLVSIGHLVTPPGANAADQYLAVLAAEPGQRDASKGIGRILGLLSRRAVKAIAAGSAESAIEPIMQAQVLAEKASLRRGAAFDAFVAPIHQVVEEIRGSHHDLFDTSALVSLEPLLPALAKIDPKQAAAISAELDHVSGLLRTGGRFRDPDGPEMVLVTANAAGTGGPGHAFAIAVDEVTRGDYARFAGARRRESARCRASQSLLARLTRLQWRNPDFAQGEDHPVVCVSWDDANAYASWLSTRTGARYRLPNDAEWLFAARKAGAGTRCGVSNIGAHARDPAHCDDAFAQTSPVGRFPPTPPGLHDISGNVSEWTNPCAQPAKAPTACTRHTFRGLSWQDDDDQSNLIRSDGADADVGYANVGFRVVRDVPAANGVHP